MFLSLLGNQKRAKEDVGTHTKVTTINTSGLIRVKVGSELERAIIRKNDLIHCPLKIEQNKIKKTTQ